ncbi:MAG: hypothetical protein ACJ74J_09980 [Blastocatellia bacterium]
MSVRLINSAPSAAEFHIEGNNAAATKIQVHGGGEAIYPTSTTGTTEISTAQQWTLYAIINGITTSAVETTDPDATIKLVPDNHNGYFLEVS